MSARRVGGPFRPRRGVAVADFCLQAAAGEVTCLRDLLQTGPVLVWFYRGHWCEDSRRALAQLRDHHAALRAQGVQVLAVSPDSQVEAARLSAGLDLPFVLLCDPDRRVARAFGVASGQETRPGAFLLDRGGRLRWSHAAHDPADQPRLDEVRDVLEGPATLAVHAPSDVLTPAVAAVVVVGLTLLGLLAALAHRELLAWDAPLRHDLQGVSAAWFEAAMRAASRLGSRSLIAGLTVILAVAAWPRCRQLAVVLVGSFPAAAALELVLKAVVDRPRPTAATGFGNSFPSGHVLAAVAFWGLVPAWVYLLTRRRWAWSLSVAAVAPGLVAVGVSRVYLGQHWPSDVVGGYLAGAVFLLAAEWSLRRPTTRLRCEACDLHPLRGPPLAAPETRLPGSAQAGAGLGAEGAEAPAERAGAR